MSKLSKLAGVIVGASTVAVLGVALAQGQPPNPLIGNHALAAGQQSTHITPMGETGVLSERNVVYTATITQQQDVAAVTPEPAAAEPAPAVAEAPVEQSTTAMGAPAEQPALVAKADRG